MTIYAGADPQRAPETLQTILDELNRLCDEPVPPEELHKAKEYIKGRLVLGLEDSFSQAAWVAHQTLFLETVQNLDQVLQAYDAVTIADVQAVAQTIIKPTAYNLAAIGPFGRAEKLRRVIAG